MAHHLPAQGVVAPDVSLRFVPQTERQWGIDYGTAGRLAIDQAVQDVEDMGLGGRPRIERQFDRAKHYLLIVLEHQREDLDHLPVTAGALEEMTLQPSERIGHLVNGAPLRSAPGLRWITAR